MIDDRGGREEMRVGAGVRVIRDSRKKKVYRQQEASKQRLMRSRATGEGRGSGDEAVAGGGDELKWELNPLKSCIQEGAK